MAISASMKTSRKKIGEEIAHKGYWLLCGGFAGIMEAASRGAKKHGGLTIGILPKAIAKINDENKSDAWPNSYIDVAIFTGLGGGIDGRNQVIVNSCDAIIALPGNNTTGRGTRSEIDFALDKKVPLVLHGYWRTVSDPGPIVESEPLVQYYDTAAQAADKAIKAIEQRVPTIKLTTSRR